MMADGVLPPNLENARHWDWPWPFSIVPRRWTAFDWARPVLIAGNQASNYFGHPLPIGERGSWQISKFPGAPAFLSHLPLYFAFTTKTGRHFRIGARWDDVDGYVEFPSLAIKEVR